MLEDMKKILKQIDNTKAGSRINCTPPTFSPKTHYLDIADSLYYRTLISFRHAIRKLCDCFMGEIYGAYNVDLFMFTNSVSSPMGPGSDSEAIQIQFGNLITNLVDSSQFGFEPILLNGFKKVYCYLPSMRGENPDSRHLNQFYHCEAEILGDLNDIKDLSERFIKYISNGVLELDNHLFILSRDYQKTKSTLKILAHSNSIQEIKFDDACKLLEDSGFTDSINYTDHGRDISSRGELELMNLLDTRLPVWLTHFDRDRVPFYQKPDPNNPSRVLNADLLFPPIIESSFGGEILGAGQRQDRAHEIIESIKRQDLDSEPYNWYIDLRNHPRYTTTSGFGMGIERYITWLLGLDDIKLALPYPRLKNVETNP